MVLPETLGKAAAHSAKQQVVVHGKNHDLTVQMETRRVVQIPEKLSPPTTHESLVAIDAKYVALREETRCTIQRLLDEKAGNAAFPSLKTKKEFAESVRERLRRVKLCLDCPTCHRPGMLKAVPTAGGLFQIDHSIHGSRGTCGGTQEVPVGCKVIDAPPDRRVKTFDRI